MKHRALETADLTVTKFGGESMLAMETVKDRLFEDDRRRLAVVSALGKLSVERTMELGYREGVHIEKITNQLIDFCRNGSEDILEDIVGRHAFEAERLCIFGDDAERRRELIDAFERTIRSHYESGEFADVELMGEVMSGTLLAAYLGDDAVFIDPRDVIVFESLNPDPNGNHPIDLPETARRIREKITASNSTIAVLGGYGGQYQGKTYLLQRSGTDVIGAAVTNALGASKYEVFKEVKGVYVTNPTLLRDVDIEPTDDDIIRKLTYDEARDIGVAGSEVLQRDAIGYLWDKNEPHSTTREITTVVRSSSQPSDPGTEIVPRRTASKHETIINFNVRDDYAYFKVHEYGLNGKLDYAKSLLEFMGNFDSGNSGQGQMKPITWDHMPTGTDSITVVMPARQFKQWAPSKDQLASLHDFDSLIEGLQTAGFNVEVSGPMGAIHLVGQEHANPDKIARILGTMGTALHREGVGLFGGTTQINTTSSVWFTRTNVYRAATRAVYEAFIRDPRGQ